MTIQDKINNIQSIYKEWLSLQLQLTQAQQAFEKSNRLIKELEVFYFDGEWGEIYDKIGEGLAVDLTTEGECSVMSEDTLWNAFHEQQALSWGFLRMATKSLDKDKPEFYAN